MKFVIDAGLPPWMVRAFAAAGHDAMHVESTLPANASDQKIAEHARVTGRAIVTRDFDFSNVRAFEPSRFDGIVVLTIPRDRGSAYMRLLLARLFEFLRTVDSIRGKLLIVEVNRIRVRD